MADILDFCEGQPVVRFQSGETIIPEGARLGKLFVLIEGQIEVIRKDTQVSHVDEPGSILGEMSVLLDMPHSATVKALSDVETYVIDDALLFLESRSEVAIHLATLLARRLYYTTTYLVDLQQQSEGRRKDLDVVDQILGSLVDPTDSAGNAPAAKPARKKK
jgi:CRP/FNR family cyclic AMP-dependent transcriptional regulator